MTFFICYNGIVKIMSCDRKKLFGLLFILGNRGDILSFMDCFAHQEQGCNILKEKLCDNGGCPFYKTREQVLEDRIKYPPIDYKYFLETGEKIILERKSERKSKW